MNARTAALALLTSCFMTLAPAASHAQAETGVDYEKARAIYDLAMKHYDDGKLDLACPLFAESLELAAKAGTAFWLGECHEKTGDALGAYRAFTRASELATAAGKDDRAKFARERAGKLLPQLNQISLTIPAELKATKGLEIALDGEVIPPKRWSQGQAVGAGKHRVVARAPDKAPQEVTVEVSGKSRSFVVALSPLKDLAASGDKPQPAPPTPDEGGGMHPVAIGGWVVGAAGLAAIGGGVGLGFVAKSQYDGAEGCNELNECNQSGFDTRNDARTMGTIGTIVTAGGGALAAAGLLMILLAPSNGPDEAEPSEAAALARGISLSISPQGAGASLTLPLAW